MAIETAVSRAELEAFVVDNSSLSILSAFVESSLPFAVDGVRAQKIVWIQVSFDQGARVCGSALPPTAKRIGTGRIDLDDFKIAEIFKFLLEANIVNECRKRCCRL